MMKNTNRKRIIRRALSLLFALMLLWESGALTPSARAAEVVAADGTVTVVLWQRVSRSDPISDLQRYCSDKPHPILMSYKSNKTEYFLCATKDNWRWEKKDYSLVGMPTIYDRQFDGMRDVWKTWDICSTIGTYNCLWAQYKEAKWGSDGYAKIVFNVSDGHDGPGEFLGPGKSYGGQNYGGHKVRDTCFVVRPQETTTWRIAKADKYFRMYNRDYDGDDEDVIFHGGTVVLSDDEREDIASIFVGDAVTASALTRDFTVLADQATTMGRSVSYIPEGVTLRVANGGVLTVDGILLNDGKIVVEEGGLLVVREKSLVTPFNSNSTNCGGISSAGTIVMEKDGKLIGGGANGVYLTGGVVYNYGVIAGENFTVTKELLINNQKDGYVIAGRTLPKERRDILLRNTYESYVKNKSLVSEYGKTTYYTACLLPYGKVNIAQNAVYGNTAGLKNYGSFGSAAQEPESRLAKVFFHDGSSTSEVLRAPRGELDYRLSNTGTGVTRREVVYADTDAIEQLREAYWKKYRAETGAASRDTAFDQAFDAYLTSYFSAQGIDLNEKVTVRDGIITVNGLPALTIPWNQTFSVAFEFGSTTTQNPTFGVSDMYLVSRKRPIDLGERFSLGG